jgi:deoxyribonuclease-4
LQELEMTFTKRKTPRYPLIGAHMSIAGGTWNALLDGEALHCAAIQIFASSNTQWHAKIPDDMEVRRFREEQRRTAIAPVIVHNCYLINLASPDEVVFNKSFARMKIEMQICDRLGLPCLVMHPGSHTGQGEHAAIRQVARAVNDLLTTSRPRILYEITAGQGTDIGHTFEQIAELIGLAKDKDRVGVCYDTCHAFAAGYDIRTRRAYRDTMRRFDNLVGLDRIWAFHFNDAKRELGSRIDRHEHIGRGRLGEDAFRFILRDERFREMPKILETPKGRGMYWDRRNLALLRRLAGA